MATLYPLVKRYSLFVWLMAAYVASCVNLYECVCVFYHESLYKSNGFFYYYNLYDIPSTKIHFFLFLLSHQQHTDYLLSTTCMLQRPITTTITMKKQEEDEQKHRRIAEKKIQRMY